MSVKVRIAPSPTGNLHIGTARTALFNWLFARRHGGQFVIRIEDTDLERSKKEYEENIISGLKWLGIESDVAITRQSERLDMYREHLQKLLDSGKAFWCHHSIAELEAEKKAQMDRKEAPRHICDHKGTDKAKQPGQIIRLAVDGNSDRKIEFNDMIRGPIATIEGNAGDLSLAKNLDTPLYNFAVVVDDVTMGITHVIRGEDHISNTPKQILIYEALGEKVPTFAHLPLILNPDKTKLSKRAGATSVDDYRKDYLPEALINFMGFLGYTYSKEILTKEEMAQEFDVAKVHKSGAVFDTKKLNWINTQYVRKLAPDIFKELIGKPDLPDAAVPIMTERLEKLSDIEAFGYLWGDPAYEHDLLIWKNSTPEQVKMSLQQSRAIVAQHGVEDKDGLRKQLDESAHDNRGLVYWPFRVALSGRKASPDPVDIASIIGKEVTLQRIDAALQRLSS